MAKNLVIVESPAKVKTIQKFLGSNYEVAASNGHVRDLPKSRLGIDVENDFEPRYITIRGKGDLLADLRKSANKAEKVYLATDPDREGEAISWHLAQALKLDDKKMRRITFNEITKNAVKASLKEPRAIDQNLVDEQQARRMLDRMVGYEISPLLWKKIKRGLSAGRVQSVALHIIADREAEIDAFIPTEYWSLDAALQLPGEKKPLIAHFHGKGKEKMPLSDQQQVQDIMDALQMESFIVQEIKRGERTKKAPLPFTTSTLQQEAAKALNFSTQKTMRIAQQLYEGIDLKKEGTVGLISYLRTDSTRVSEEADQSARAYIQEQFGEEFVSSVHTGNQNKNAQDAHEAIRPTDVKRTPVHVKEYLSRDQFRLYQLIWKRFLASRMEHAKYETLSVKIQAGEYVFTASASKIIFEGFMNVYTQADDEEKKESSASIRKLEKGDQPELQEFLPEQHFTQPPSHYTEASLVKTLEELGIGRPSTYAPTISTLLNRRYILKENKNLYITELGEAVNTVMVTAFPTIVDVNFTANMEGLLDCIGAGSVKWKTVISNFWPDLAEAVANADRELEQITIEDEVTDVICENCGRNMVIKYGPHGKFLACPGFPDCRNTKSYMEKAGVACPKCGGEILIRKSKKGRRYFGCEHNPECDFMSWQKPSDKKCPQCGSYMLEKGKKLACSDPACGYVEMAQKNEKAES
ncbi:MAG: type I DNA topoisomerase [Lachnospiraceae bacterium]|nr:type I DNA topoisomerase [Lachnospiraceae bacterium]